MIINFNQKEEYLFLVDLQDLIFSKVDHLKGNFSILIKPLDIIGLYNYQDFLVNCNYNIQKLANSFLINLEISASIPIACDLCGNNFFYEFYLRVKEIFTSYFEYRNKFDDMYYFIFDGKQIDIGKVCIENFISNLPMKFVDGCS